MLCYKRAVRDMSRSVDVEVLMSRLQRNSEKKSAPCSPDSMLNVLNELESSPFIELLSDMPCEESLDKPEHNSVRKKLLERESGPYELQVVSARISSGALYQSERLVVAYPIASFRRTSFEELD